MAAQAKGFVPGLFRDRRDAGRKLAARLSAYAGRSDVVVVALPRGGVPIGYEVAQALRARLDVFVVRKLGVPDHEEVAMGAVASGGVRVLNRDVIDRVGIAADLIDGVTAREKAELARRERLYRGGRPAPAVGGAPSFWLMTDWRRAPPCRRPSRRCASSRPPASSLPFRSRRARPVTRCGRKPTR